MNAPVNRHAEQIERLLQRGLDYYGRGLVADAVAQWRDVLALDPHDQRAREYLTLADETFEESGSDRWGGPPPTVTERPLPAGERGERTPSAVSAAPAASVAPPSQQPPQPALVPTGFDPAPILRAVGERRLDDALTLTFEALDRFPQDPQIPPLLSQIRDRLATDAVARLGRLDYAPRASSGARPTLADGFDEATISIFERVNGVSTADDLLQLSRLPRYKTLSALLALTDAGLVEWSDVLGLPVHVAPRPRTSSPVPSSASVPPVLRLVPSNDAQRSPPPPPVSAPPAPSAPPASQNVARRRVLLVEENAAQQHLVQLFLQDGYEVRCAKTLRDALGLVSAARPDLVLASFMLSGSNGADVITQVRHALATPTLPGLLVASKLELAMVKGRAAAIGVAVLTRPLDAAGLVRACNELLA